MTHDNEGIPEDTVFYQPALGRPPSRDWEAVRGDITSYIKLGYSVHALADVYNMSRAGMAKVLHKLELRTTISELRHRSLDELIKSYQEREERAALEVAFPTQDKSDAQK
jgi:hypothetical protein